LDAPSDNIDHPRIKSEGLGDGVRYARELRSRFRAHAWNILRTVAARRQKVRMNDDSPRAPRNAFGKRLFNGRFREFHERRLDHSPAQCIAKHARNLDKHIVRGGMRRSVIDEYNGRVWSNWYHPAGILHNFGFWILDFGFWKPE